MGQTRQELCGRSGGASGLHCTCCGESLTGAIGVTAVLREIVYEYCGEACRDRHADAVVLQPAGCERCDLDAAGDTGRCAAHLHDEVGDRSGDFPLAS